jgi:hypothetical protein
MSLLHQQNTEDLDDAAQGEELTKGTSHVVIAALIALMVVSAIVAIYVIAGQKPPYATAQVTSIWVHPQTTETSAFDASGAPITQQSVDQVMVFTTVRLKNQTNHPILLSNVTTNATLDDGIHSSYAATKGDYDRTFIAYPDLSVPHLQGISPINTTIAPGQTVEGNIVSSFRMTQKQWDARKDFDYTFYFQYQAPLTVKPTVPVTVR